MNRINTDQIFEEWGKNKARFIQKLGGLIYESPEVVTFELDSDNKNRNVDQFLSWVYHEYGENMYAFFKDNYDAILNNKLEREYEGYPSGMKLSKVLMQKFGSNAEEVRQKLSMLIQSNKICGKLCISVHPLDYLSASENNHGWRSCHALDGEYRAGNVSYMMDTCTIIVYLKSADKEVKLPRFPEDVPWNDKKWRCYFYFDPINLIVYAGRQYPFHSDTALDLCSDLFYKFKYFDPDWDGRYVYDIDTKFRPYGIRGVTEINGMKFNFDETKVIVGNESDRAVVPLKRFVETDPDAMCYNDLLLNHSYAPRIMTYSTYCWLPRHVSTKMVVGKGFNCVCCGERLPSDSDSFCCSNCEEEEEYVFVCRDCGDVFHDINYLTFNPAVGGYQCNACFQKWMEKNRPLCSNEDIRRAETEPIVEGLSF